MYRIIVDSLGVIHADHCNKKAFNEVDAIVLDVRRTLW